MQKKYILMTLRCLMDQSWWSTTVATNIFRPQLQTY
jgi:hypothetical protein